jgi:hypothetical protein
MIVGEYEAYLLHRAVVCGEGLGLDALARIHQDQRTLARRQ